MHVFWWFFIFISYLVPLAIVLSILTDILIKKIYSVTMILGIYHTVIKFIIKLMVSLFIIKLSPQENMFKSSLLCINCKHKNLNMKLHGEINCDVSRWFRFKVFPNDTLNSISIYVKFSQSLFLTGMASCKRYAPSMSDKKKLPHIFPKKIYSPVLVSLKKIFKAFISLWIRIPLLRLTEKTEKNLKRNHSKDT